MTWGLRLSTWDRGLTLATRDLGRATVDSVEDWLIGRRISLSGRNKVVLAGGMSSRTGDALRLLAAFTRYLQNNFGYAAGDFLEVSYYCQAVGAGWRPAPYEPRHCEDSLDQSAAQVAHSLRWYRSLLPDDTVYHLVGYSLGGVALFAAAASLVEAEPDRWRGRLATLITLSAPLFGSDLGPEGDLLGALGLGVLFTGARAVRELVARGRSPGHRTRVEREAERLRAFGIELLTLADASDVVVTPEDAVIAPPGQRARFVLRGPPGPRGQADTNPFGHGPLLDNTLAWVQIAKLIGPQLYSK